MPAAYLRSHWLVSVSACLSVLLTAWAACAQPAKPANDAPRVSALKLPDGTIVLLTRSPDEVNPPIDGVLLSGKEYQAMLDQLELARKQKESVKPVSPNSCHIQGKVVAAGKQTVAALTLTYVIQTQHPRTMVSLGCARGFPRTARWESGELPLLRADKDGLSVLITEPGKHTLTLDVDTPVGTRGSAGEMGFELALPRAPITTLSLSPPSSAIRDVTIGSRTPDRPTEIKRSIYSVQRLGTTAGVALGPSDLLDVLWEVPLAPTRTTDSILTAETDATVRIDEVQIETTAKIRLRGVTKEWKLALPIGADVHVERTELPAGSDIAAELGFSAAVPALVPPTDSAKSIWTLKPPEGTSQTEWTVHVVMRQARPKPSESKFRGPYPIGPFSVLSARQSGTIRVHAPNSIRALFKHGPAVRRQDLPADASEEMVALFRFTEFPMKPGKAAPPPLLEVDATQAVGFVRIEPNIRVHLAALDPKPTSTYWRLDARLAVTPIRSEMGQLIVELPPGWDKFEAGPLDVVDGITVTDVNNMKRYTIRLFASQRAPFELTVSANFPVDPKNNQVSLPLLSFPQAVEQTARLTATVPEGLTLRGSAMGRSRDRVDGLLELAPSNRANPNAARTSISATFEKGVRRVDLAWSPYRPELPVKIDTGITVMDRQARVEQTFQFGPVGAPGEPIRFRSLATLPPFLKFNPPLTRDPIDGDLIFRTPVGATEFVLKCSYWPAFPDNPGADGNLRCVMPLLWPEGITSAESRVRVWGDTGSLQVSGFEGNWGELPPAPDPERGVLPWLTLAGTGSELPLVLNFQTKTDNRLPQVWVDRVMIQARTTTGEDSVQYRARFRLSRWPSSGVLITVPVPATPTVTFAGVQINNLSVTSEETVAENTSRILHVPLPMMESEPQTLEIGYRVPNLWTTRGATRLIPPYILHATYQSSTRWRVQFDRGVVPLYFGSDLLTPRRWGWRGAILTPAAAETDSELEEWFQTGKGSTATAQQYPTADDVSAFTGNQGVPGPISIYRIPWTAWIISGAVFTLVFGLLLTRLSSIVLGPTIAVVGMLVCIGMLYWPQPLMRSVTGIQPGIWALCLILTGQSAVRWYHQRRIDHLPGFTRSRVEPGSTGSQFGKNEASPAAQYTAGSDVLAAPVENAQTTLPVSGRS